MVLLLSLCFTSFCLLQPFPPAPSLLLPLSPHLVYCFQSSFSYCRLFSPKTHRRPHIFAAIASSPTASQLWQLLAAAAAGLCLHKEAVSILPGSQWIVMWLFSSEHTFRLD